MAQFCDLSAEEIEIIYVSVIYLCNKFIPSTAAYQRIEMWYFYVTVSLILLHINYLLHYSFKCSEYLLNYSAKYNSSMHLIPFHTEYDFCLPLKLI